MLNHSAPIDPIFLSFGPASVSELARPLPISLPGVMQHLAVLEGSGLVRTEKVGRVRSCTLDGAALAAVDGWLTDQRRRWERRLDRPGAFLSGEAPGAGSEASPSPSRARIATATSPDGRRGPARFWKRWRARSPARPEASALLLPRRSGWKSS